jgi:predicted MFS family arabinose efflux permease
MKRAFYRQLGLEFRAIERPLRAQILVFTFTRLIFNTLYRMVYPFLPVFSRGLGVDISTLSLALTNRSVIGMLGPFLASIADRRGRKVGMLFSVGLFISGATVMIIWPSYPGFVIMLILTSLGKFGFDPSMQAYLGDRIPYQRRGMALSVTELGWSLSFFVGIPIISLLIARQGWASPFAILAFLGLAAGVVLIRLVPRDSVSIENPINFWQNFRRVFRFPPALAGLALGLSATIANETINLIFGVWMEASFGLKVIALGGTAAVIGIAELIAEVLVGVTVDKIGKVRAVAIGLLANCLAALAFPFFGDNLVGALICLFFFFFTFEYMLVSTIPMMTEIMPNARATLMAFNVAGLSLGRALGALIGPSLFLSGIGFSAGAAVLFNLLALASLFWVRKAVN